MDITAHGLVEKEGEELYEVYWYIEDENPEANDSETTFTWWVRCDESGISIVHESTRISYLSDDVPTVYQTTDHWEPAVLVLPRHMEIGDAWSVNSTSDGTVNGKPNSRIRAYTYTVSRADTVVTPIATYDTLVVTEFSEIRSTKNHYAEGVGLVRFEETFELVSYTD